MILHPLWIRLALAADLESRVSRSKRSSSVQKRLWIGRVEYEVTEPRCGDSSNEQRLRGSFECGNVVFVNLGESVGVFGGVKRIIAWGRIAAECQVANVIVQVWLPLRVCVEKLSDDHRPGFVANL